MRGEIFITGATGFIGSGVLEKWLTAQPDVRINLLVRSRRGERPSHRVTNLLREICPGTDAASLEKRLGIIDGDVSAPDFGLSGEAYRSLSDRTSHIIHCAAAVRFDLPLEEARAINVAGSENAVALARKCKRLERLDYVGTAYVAGKRTGLITEDQLDLGQEHNNTYERTKLESEKLMRQAMKDLPISILRPSIVICDSRTGRTSRYSAFFRMLMRYCLGQLTMLPGDASTLMDIVPIDYVTETIYALARLPGSTGKCYHLTAGTDSLTSLSEISELSAEHFAREKFAIVSPGNFDAMIAKRGASLSEDERGMIEEIGIYRPYLTSTWSFDKSNTLGATGSSGARVPPLKSYFARLAAYIRGSSQGHN